jgi:hypothetical protein
MEGRAKLWFHSDLPGDMHPKCICELRISIWYNHSRQPVLPPPTFENWLWGLQRGCGSHNRHHVCQLGKPHYNHQDSIISLWLRQTCDEVHTYTMPWPWRDRQRSQEAALLLVRGSVHSASTQAFTKWIISYICTANGTYVIPFYGEFISPLWLAMRLWYFSLNVNSLNLPCGTYTQFCLYLNNPSTNLTSFSALPLQSSPRSFCTSG